MFLMAMSLEIKWKTDIFLGINKEIKVDSFQLGNEPTYICVKINPFHIKLLKKNDFSK